MGRPRKRRARATTASAQLVELGAAAPLVAAARLSRMALAGANPSARDRREFSGMVSEKQAAFAQSWAAMWAEAWSLQAQLAWSWWLSPTAAAQARLRRTASTGFDRIMASGVAPWHRQVLANARRLRS
ncbi:polyhydroxyalkanoate granule-associated phasin [Luteimonas kalidii]|uniref:Phasin domain-containing protein n=1 Tax=Luteimonas kalidii TaxID=3042025 RepID=A0ABT6JV31_9GAMM|nr:polyhydroxyalkanoate granule-associated phasin [Luteimonas kalidii]MDH5834345.1 hypothetical protein [Luteimonas kalidii]